MAKHAGLGISILALMMVCPWSARAQAEAEARAVAQIGPGTSVNALLETRLDARSAKVGDTVTARTSRAVKSGESVVLPRGSKLLGRIGMVQAGAEASARSESKLGVSFDRAVLPDGTEIAVDLAIQAIAAAESEDPARGMRAAHGLEGAIETSPFEAPGRRSARGGLLGGAADELLGDAPGLGGRSMSDVEIGANAQLARAVNFDGTLSASSQGVIGLKGLQLDSTGKSSVLMKTSGPVTLSSGTRLLLRAKGEASH